MVTGAGQGALGQEAHGWPGNSGHGFEVSHIRVRFQAPSLMTVRAGKSLNNSSLSVLIGKTGLILHVAKAGWLVPKAISCSTHLEISWLSFANKYGHSWPLQHSHTFLSTLFPGFPARCGSSDEGLWGSREWWGHQVVEAQVTE